MKPRRAPVPPCDWHELWSSTESPHARRSCAMDTRESRTPAHAAAELRTFRCYGPPFILEGSKMVTAMSQIQHVGGVSHDILDARRAEQSRLGLPWGRTANPDAESCYPEAPSNLSQLYMATCLLPLQLPANPAGSPPGPHHPP